jgi:transposase
MIAKSGRQVMIVGVDVHRRARCAALIDERGVVLGTLSFTNSAAGIGKLRAWLTARDAQGAVVGIENGAGYGQLLCISLAAAGHEVLNVPAWRTKRDRGRHGPGKSDPGDAVAIARVVLCAASASARRSSPSWCAPSGRSST